MVKIGIILCGWITIIISNQELFAKCIDVQEYGGVVVDCGDSCWGECLLYNCGNAFVVITFCREKCKVLCEYGGVLCGEDGKKGEVITTLL